MTIVNKLGKQYGKIKVMSRGPDLVADTYRKVQWWCLCLECGAGFLAVTGYLDKTKSWMHGCRVCSYRRRTQLLRGPKSGAGLHFLFLQYRGAAKTRGHSFELSEDELEHITSQNCAYCGSAPSQVCKPNLVKGRTAEGVEWAAYTYNGVDRIDNNIGYVLSNCVPCCGKCNLMKRGWSVEEFLTHIRKIANFNKE